MSGTDVTAPDALAKRIAEAEKKAKDAVEKLRQLKARKAANEARQKAIESKRLLATENKLRFEAGGLVKLAGLLSLDQATLLGALLIEADKLRDPQYLVAAKLRGGEALAKLKAAPTSVKQP